MNDSGEIASTFDKPELVSLGECKLIDEIMVGEDKLIRFSGCKSGTACSIILRGASSHLLGETSLHTCIHFPYAKLCNSYSIVFLYGQFIDRCQISTTVVSSHSNNYINSRM